MAYADDLSAPLRDYHSRWLAAVLLVLGPERSPHVIRRVHPAGNREELLLRGEIVAWLQWSTEGGRLLMSAAGPAGTKIEQDEDEIDEDEGEEWKRGG